MPFSQFHFVFLGQVLLGLRNGLCEWFAARGRSRLLERETRTSGVINANDGVEYVCAVCLRWKRGNRISESYVHLFEDDDYNRWVEHVPGLAKTGSVRFHWAYNAGIVPWLNRSVRNVDIREWANDEEQELEPETVPARAYHYPRALRQLSRPAINRRRRRLSLRR